MSVDTLTAETTQSDANDQPHGEPLIQGGLDFTSLTETVCSVAEVERPPRAWYIAMAISLSLLGVFGVSVVYLLFTGVGVWGVNNAAGWGFAIVNFVFWIGIGHAGTLISAILFLFRQKWRTSINRFAEAMTIFAVICAGTFAGIHVGRAWFAYWLFPIPNEMAMYPNFSSPLLWDLVAVTTYFTVSLLFWYTGLLPDLATLRDRAKTKTRKFFYGLFALGWNGSSRHWHRFECAYMILAALATPLVLSVHSIVSFDFASSQLPGWHATIFPPYFVAGAVFGGFAMVLTLAIPARQFFGLKNIITLKHLENMNKVILTTSLIVGYAYAMEFFTAWYSGNLTEMFVFKGRAFGPYAWAYWVMISCNVIAPQFHWFKRVRTNIWAMFLIAMAVNVGMWFERYVIVVSTLTSDFLPSSWEYYSPTWIDGLTLLGSFGLFFTLFLLFCRYLPMVAMAEVKTVMPQAHGEVSEANVATAPRSGECSHERDAPVRSYARQSVDETETTHPNKTEAALQQATAEFNDQEELHSLLVEFNAVSELKAAAVQVRDAGYSKWDTYSPLPIHGIDKVMGIPRSRLPWLVLAFGVTGAIVGLTLQWWLNASDAEAHTWAPNFLRGYGFRISGKPLFKLPANIPVIFEATILFAAIAVFIGMLASNNLPLWYQAVFGNRRFRRATSDRFFLSIEADDEKFDEPATRSFLTGLGGSKVERVTYPDTPPAPSWLPLAGVAVFALALLPPVWAYKTTVTKSPDPRVQIAVDMDNQERFEPQQAHALFADGRASRPEVAGVIARGDAWKLGTDRHFYDGRTEGEWATTFPKMVEVDETFMLRGQQRYEIYCAACHGYDGSGQGIVAKRLRANPHMATGWAPPSSLHDLTMRERPVGHVFNTITNGIRTMPAHGDQISPRDRWAIVAYVRALQRSQYATINDVPEEERAKLETEK